MFLLLFSVYFSASNVSADFLDDMMKASNWYHKEKYPKNCIPTFTLNMKIIGRKNQKSVEVSSNQIGFSPIAFIELNHSANKENLPIYGQGAILDIFVKKQITKDGYDYWIECPPKVK